MKIDKNYIKHQYQSGIENYVLATEEIGLWVSEKAVIEQYFDLSDRILDLGCGTGRTTFGLHDLGHHNVFGVDLTSGMIDAALVIQERRGTSISFAVGDATDLSFAGTSFDAVLFSFNGLFSIPQSSGRTQAFREIYRVLKAGGTFVFTSHDRNKNPHFFEFWSKERVRWDNNSYDPRLHEFGDIIAKSGNETKPIYIHIPSQEEVEQLLSQTGFVVKETFMRDEYHIESVALKQKSSDCRFWIVEKD